MLFSEDIDHIRALSRDADAFEALVRLFQERVSAALSRDPEAQDVFNWSVFLAQSSDVFVAYDADLRYVAVSRKGASLVGRKAEEVVGKTNAELIGPAAESIEPYVRRCFDTNNKVFVVHEIPTSDGVKLYDSIYTPIAGEEGQVQFAVGICRDVTEDKRRMKLLEQTVEAQAATLQELSTPLLHISPGVLLIPLIGKIDDRRAQKMTEVLMRGIAEFGAHTAIIDITGVSNVDDHVANTLLGGARAAGLLGASVVLTGISPEVAQTLVALRTPLQGVATYSSLQQGFTSVVRRGAPDSPSRRGRRASSVSR
jgi:rsbT co-antagonist protein RsbR